MPGKTDRKSPAGRNSGNVLVAFLVVLIGIGCFAFLAEMAMRAGIRFSALRQNGEAMAQEAKIRQAEPQVWVGELHTVRSSGSVRFLQAKGSFRTRPECDAWVQRTADSRKFSHYGIAEREVVQAGDQADEVWDAINYRDKYNTWAAFCYRAR